MTRLGHQKQNSTAVQTNWGNCVCVCVVCVSWPVRERGRAAPKLPSPSGLGKMNSVPPQSLSLPPSLPCSFAWGFDTHPPREIEHFHIPVIFPGMFCFLKTVFVCQHVRRMGGWVCSQAERETVRIGGVKMKERGQEIARKKHFKSGCSAKNSMMKVK